MFIQEVFVFFCVYTCRVEPMNLATEDAILASQCAEGNEMARERLYKEYAARVYMLCVRYAGDGDLAKDLMQDCFIRVFENIRKFDSSKASLRTWISHITVNYLIDYLRKNRKLSYISIDEHILDIPEPEKDDFIKVPQEAVLEMITKLPDTKRIIFNMYCLENYSHKEIARLLGIKEKTSSSILYKARVMLADMVNSFIKEKGL